MQYDTPYQPSSQQPLVSFIITAYNLPVEYVQECLNSILSLSLSRSEREIILIDDGSDSSPLDDLLDIRSEIIYLRQRNRGTSEARNIGLRLATGQYIQFIDGDDYLIQASYEHCLDIVRYKAPDIVTFDSTSNQDNENSFSFEGPETGSSYLHRTNLHATVWGYIFRHNILMNLRFTPGVLYGEDEEFTPQLFIRADKLFSTNSKAYHYRKQKHSIIQQKDTKHKLRRLADTEHVIFRLQDVAQRLPEKDRVALQRRIAQLSMDYLYNTIRLTKSKKHLDEAIKHLRSRALFPLPDKKYTKKYSLFRQVINTKIGRILM